MSTTKELTHSAKTASPSTHATLRVYNTLTKHKEPFRTVEPGKVGIYLCGPTVYDKAHIGHMVGPVIFDCIKRYLVYCGYDVSWIVNITDVDDKLIKKANERNLSMLEVAEENIADYRENLAGLGVNQIDHLPRATECMDDIIAFVEKLIQRGYAYESDGDVYFDVSKDAAYGKLSNRSLESIQGEGGEMADRKRHTADFALWKAAKPGEPSWDSPWKKGRPGWHIECSAMSHKLLGQTFDIHGGGLDLVFPHHENEIAQSECCHGKPMVNYWMHNGLLRADPAAGKIGGRGEREQQAAAVDPEDAVAGKMSRSKGAGGLANLIARQGGDRIRFFLLRTHYRSTVLFSESAIQESATGQETFFRFFKRFERISGESFYTLPAATKRIEGEFDPANDELLQAVHASRNRFLAAMDDDFNTGGAIGELFDLVRTLNKFCDTQQLENTEKRSPTKLKSFRHGTCVLRELTQTLGLFDRPVESSGSPSEDTELVGQLIELLIDLRATARKKKDFTMADTIRNRLGELKITLEDRPGGTEWAKG
ncbi:MAG: cysteine--tRNA ligase [Pirellulales bacterium]|nr:cysteine--tRNA ligase [Pirellulales bacterium]